ncbi:carbonic anhydrase family protein [Leptothoe kymatousa TAU-MAC 1615]|uniref:carbonic anhydrase n=2 Tax=Leptothoe TaxID=2651725 RepID=A0ABS5Y7Q5_9CYAN|nr:carbonic anhydrase family protein [Leptothoe kymatousa TAU-MAC 1615]
MDRRAVLKYSLLGLTASSLGMGSLQSIVKAAEGNGKKPSWGYTGAAGPESWGELSDEFAICSTGTSQSPINLTSAVDADLTSLSFDYQDTFLAIVNNGHTIQANYEPGSTLQLDGQSFELKQFHFHAPSEHIENGVPTAMEVHFVHQNPDTGALAVIGVFLKEGRLNQALQPIWSRMPKTTGGQKTLDTGFNASSLLPGDASQFYRYYGSLTTPPCSEVVNWIVMKEPISVSRIQVARFIQAIGERNARPVQSLNRRFLLD